MAHKRKRINRGANASLGSRPFILALLALFVLIGCTDLRSDYSDFETWITGTANRPAASSNVNQSSPPDVERKAAVSEKEEHSTRRLKEQQSAAARELMESRRARSAAQAAKKQYEQASEAYREASQAAVRAGGGVQAAAPSNSSSGAPNSGLSQPPGSPVILTSISEGSTDQNQARTVAMIREINESLAKIGSAKLDPNEAKRRDLAAQLVQSARRALVQNDYLEAKSLAEKASVMLAPLTSNEPKATPSR